jgi:hypothetical protein
LPDPLLPGFGEMGQEFLWPERYQHDPEQPTGVRDREILELRNVWRAARGLPLLEAPLAPDVRSHDPEVPGALERWLAALDSEAKGKEIARLEAAGLGALPWVRDALESTALDPQARRYLEELAGSLTNIVRQATLETGGWKAPEALERKVKRLEGRPLDGAAFFELLISAHKALEGGTGAIELAAERHGDGKGVALRLRAERTEAPGGPSASCGGSVSTPAGSLGFWPASFSRRYLLEVETALETPHDGFVEIRFWLELPGE